MMADQQVPQADIGTAVQDLAVERIMEHQLQELEVI